MLLLLLLVACAAPVVETQPKPIETPIVNETPVDEAAASCAAILCPTNTYCENAKCIPIEAPAIDTSAPIAKQFLDEARSKFSGFAYVSEDRMVITYLNKSRHYFFKVAEIEKTPLTDIYVDLLTKTAVGYCSVEREARMMDSFELERSKCKDYIDKPISLTFSEQLIPAGPLEYLERFADKTPSRIEDNVQTISIGGNSKTIQPTLHYVVDGKNVVMNIDRRYKVPLKVRIDGEQSVDFRDVYFDVMILEEKQQKIDTSWVTYQNVSDYWLKIVQKPK